MYLWLHSSWLLIRSTWRQLKNIFLKQTFTKRLWHSCDMSTWKQRWWYLSVCVCVWLLSNQVGRQRVYEVGVHNLERKFTKKTIFKVITLTGFLTGSWFVKELQAWQEQVTDNVFSISRFHPFSLPCLVQARLVGCWLAAALVDWLLVSHFLYHLWFFSPLLLGAMCEFLDKVLCLWGKGSHLCQSHHISWVPIVLDFFGNLGGAINNDPRNHPNRTWLSSVLT